MKKIVLFVFNNDPVCFIHVLLNGLEMKEKGMAGRIVIEGSATALLPKLAESTHPLHPLWENAKTQGIVDGVCRACAHKTGSADEAQRQGLPLLADMSGHPSMSAYIEAGFEVITF